jgi:hypothetical protein
MSNSNVNVGRGLTIVTAEGRVWGRAVPKKDRPNDTVVLRIEREAGATKPFTVMVCGPADWAHKVEANGFTLEPSFLTVSRCVYDAGTKTVTVTLVHNLFDGWNQVITVSHGENWQKSVTAELINRSKAQGSETHISNYHTMTC